MRNVVRRGGDRWIGGFVSEHRVGYCLVVCDELRGDREIVPELDILEADLEDLVYLITYSMD